MRLLIIHLSDLHISGATDPILLRGQRLVEAVRNLDFEIDACVLLVSGDVAYSGAEEQYALAAAFLRDIQRELMRYHDDRVPVHAVVIPGNHDCDFSRPNAARDILLDAVSKDSAKALDQNIVSICVAAQVNFLDFRNDFAADGLQRVSELYYEYEFTVGQERVLFRCVNTAWMSSKSEIPGSLVFPPEVLVQHSAGTAAVIAVLHHPYNWFTPSNSRVFREELERISDIILTGHEHTHTRRRQIKATGETNQFIEGDVLQESKTPEISGFNALLLDSGISRQKFWNFTWSGDIYEPADSTGGEWEPFQVNSLREGEEFVVQPKVLSWLNDPGVTLTHRERGQLTLDDIFVYPDLREATYKIRDLPPIVRGDAVFKHVADTRNLLITGPEQSGKTSLAKRLFSDFRAAGLVPLLVDGAKFKVELNEKLYSGLNAVFVDQYGDRRLENFRQCDRTKRVLIIDNFHCLSLGKKWTEQFAQMLTKFAGQVVFLGNDITHQLLDIVGKDGVDSTKCFAHYRIQEFGHLLRNELVEKWFLLSPAVTDNEEEFARRLSTVVATLDTIIGRNFVPAHPVYILAVLQAQEASTPINLEASTHGYFYEQFILTSLAREGSKAGLNIRMTLLALLAYRLFEKKAREFSADDLEAIQLEYQKRYDVRAGGYAELREDLVRRSILAKNGDVYTFKYRYIYYYFVGAYFRDHIGDAQVRAQISDLTSRLYVEECANILLFLAHLSKDPFIVDAMLSSAEQVYAECGLARLDGDVSFLSQPQYAIPKPVYEERDPSEVRKALYRRLDDFQDKASADEQDGSGHDPGPSAALLDPVMRINIALKTLQILGQILKNFPGSLEGDVKARVARACYGVGLRAVSAVLALIRDNQAEIVADLVDLFKHEHPDQNERDLVSRAQKTLFSMSHLISYGILKKISRAVGSPELKETFKRVLSEFDSPAALLVDSAIKLDHFIGFPEREVLERGAELQDLPLASSLLRYLVVDHFYLFPVPFTVRQKVCEKLDISFKRIQGSDPDRKRIARQ